MISWGERGTGNLNSFALIVKYCIENNENSLAAPCCERGITKCIPFLPSDTTDDKRWAINRFE
jgi:hypothetical protein